MKITSSFLASCFLILCTACSEDTPQQLDQDSRTRVLQLEETDSLSLRHKLYRLNELIDTRDGLKVDSIHLAILNKKGLLHYKLSERDSFYNANKNLFSLSQKVKNVFFTGKSSFNLAYYFDELNRQPDSAFFYYNISKNAFLRYGDTAQAGKKLLNIATVQKNQNAFFEAKESLAEAIAYLSIDLHQKYLASAFNELATNHMKLLNYADAIAYYNKAITTSNIPGDVLSYKNNLSLVYRETREYDKALQLLEEVMADSLLKPNSSKYARVLHNLTYSQWKSGQTEFTSNFLKALHIRKQNKDYRGQVLSYTDLAEFFTEKEPQIAIHYLDSLVAVSKRIKMPEGEIDALKRYIQLEPNTIKYRDRYIFLKDSLYEQELKVKTQFAKMLYDDEQEKARLLVLETQTAKQEAKLAQRRTQNILFLSLSALLLIVGTFFYFFLRQRHKKEKLKEVYRTEKRISEQLHDGLANSVFGLMTQVQHGKNGDKELLKDLENIYKTTRQVSHENSGIKTGDDFKKELLALFRTYQSEQTTLVTRGFDDINWAKLEDIKSIAVHRALNELLVNQKKHAGASLVSLKFEIKNNQLTITYTDNGVGMDGDTSKGIGLKNTENRIQAVDGTFNFGSKPRGGAMATLAIPL